MGISNQSIEAAWQYIACYHEIKSKE